MTPQKDTLAFGQLVDDIRKIIDRYGLGEYDIDPNMLAVALVAIRINEAMHPTPSHLYQNQVADVLGRSEPYVAGLIRSGVISKNAMGKVPIAEVHLAVAGEALGKQRGRAA